MNGTLFVVCPSVGNGGRGIDKGKLGLEVADVGSGGRDSRSGVTPGIKRTTSR